MSDIVVVEDDATSLAINEKTLRSDGYAAHVHESAVETSRHFEPAAYDPILSDYFMPGLNGDEFLTANTDIQLAIDLAKTGADNHITKAIVPEVLLCRIEKNLRYTCTFVEGDSDVSVQLIDEGGVLGIINVRGSLIPVIDLNEAARQGGRE